MTVLSKMCFNESVHFFLRVLAKKKPSFIIYLYSLRK